MAIFTTDLSGVFLSVGAPVYNGDREGDKISLMFVLEDDSAYVSEILDVLKSHDVDATFFVGGKWASTHQTLVKKIAEDFELGNHGYSNENLAKLSKAKQSNEIVSCHNLIKTITSGTKLDTEQGNKIVSGVEMKLFSPPEANFNKTTLKCAEKAGYKTVMWSKNATDGIIFEKATTDIHGGEIILLSASAATLGVLDTILAEYSAKNLRAVKISDNIK